MIRLSVDGQITENRSPWPYGDDLYRTVKMDVTAQAKDGKLSVGLKALSDCTFYLQKAELDVNGEAPPVSTPNANGYEEICTKTTVGLLDPASVTHDPKAHLIDVRSPYEYVNVGHADPGVATYLQGKFHHIPWEYRFYDATGAEVKSKMYMNAQFIADIKARFKVGDTLIFICRTGARSGAAATALAKENLGFKLYNAIEGMSTNLGWIPSGYPITHSQDGIYNTVGLESVAAPDPVNTTPAGDGATPTSSSGSGGSGGCAMNPAAGFPLDLGLLALAGLGLRLRRKAA